MFNSSKYTKWYFSIINSPNKNNEKYTEKHHIIPKSLGGSDKKDNLVKLSAREHYICHLLLTKMLECPEKKQKMKYALWCLVNGLNKGNFKINSKLFQIIREQHSIHLSKIRLGKTHNDKTKKLIGEKSKLKVFSDDYRKKLSETSTGRKHTQEVKDKIKLKAKERWSKKTLEEKRKILTHALSARLHNKNI